MGITEGTHHTHEAEIVKNQNQCAQIIICLKKPKSCQITGKWLKGLWKQKSTLLWPKTSGKGFPAGGRTRVGSLRMGRTETTRLPGEVDKGRAGAPAGRWKREGAASSPLHVGSQGERGGHSKPQAVHAGLILFQEQRFLGTRFPVALVVKNPPTNAGDGRDAGSVPGAGRSPGGGRDSPLQYSCADSPLARGAWWAAVAKRRTRLSDLARARCLGSVTAGPIVWELS